MKFLTQQPVIYDYEGLPPDPLSVPCGDAKPSSQGMKTITPGTFTLSQIEEAINNVFERSFRIEGMVSTRTRGVLYDFDCGDYFHQYNYQPDIKVAHDDIWDFGRAYFESRDYQFTEFHCTLCSVDEIRQKIEAWMRQYERNRIVSDLYLIAEPCGPSIWERCLMQRHWNEDLYAWIEDIQADYQIDRKLWMADDHHSCHPYNGLLIYQHQLAKLSLSGAHPQARTAARPCCRSFLMASRRQPSGDDLLGH